MKEICGLTIEEAKYVIKQDEYFLVDEIVQAAGRVLIEEIERLKSREQNLIEKLEEVCGKVDNEMADFEAIDLKHKILEIVKGENHE